LYLISPERTTRKS